MPRKRGANRTSAKKLALVLIISCVGLSLFIGQSLIFLFAGMLPTIVAYITDRSANRFNFKTVGCMNFAGVAPFLSSLIQQGNTADAVHSMLGSSTAWLMIFGSALIGWGIVWIAPFTVKRILLVFAVSRKEKLLVKQEELIEEWGEEVKGLPSVRIST